MLQVLALGAGLALACPVLEAATHYRSIGTAADFGTLEPVLGNGTQVSVTLASNQVTGVGGTTWRAANRGRGDRINIAGVDYTILAVESDTVLSLTGAYTGATGTVNYVISRKFATLEAWVACIEFDVACPGVSSTSLVADDRAEVGIAYKDSVFIPAGDIQIPNNSPSVTTDATHDITLTADPGNRHHGVPGRGVVMDNPSCTSSRNSIRISTNYFTVEWMEVRDASSDAVKLFAQPGGNHYVVRNTLVRFPTCAYADSSVGSDGIDLDSNDHSVMRADIYNNVVSRGRFNVTMDVFDGGTSDIRFYNNVFYDPGFGSLVQGVSVRATGTPNGHIRFINNILHTGPGTGAPLLYLPSPHPSTGYNISEDASAGTACPAGNCQTGVAIGALAFANAAGNDFHIQTASVARDVGVSLATEFKNDIDGQIRSGSWDIGIDEFGSVPCCGLSVSETASTLTVTGLDEFQIRFDTAYGGGISDFRDLAEDPTIDLAGGGSQQEILFDDELDSSFRTSKDTTRGRLHLLEATPTRVKVRQQVRYSSGAATVTGLEGLGDYTIYPVGRMGLRWNRKRTLAVPYTQLELNWTAHYQVAAPLNGWAGFSESGPVPPNQAGGDDFVLLRSELPQARTDFLSVLHADWTGAHGAEAVAGGWPGFGDFYETTWTRWTNGTLPAPAAGPYSQEPGETWDFLTYFKPTSFGDHTDAAVTTRSADYRSLAMPYAISGGQQWQDASESTSTPGDFFNESEAAFVFDMTPGSTFLFDIAGSVANPRYSPFFKIRQWRSLTEFPTVTLEGTLLQKDVDYKAAVKPVARAHFAQDLLWYSTFESPAATGGPAVGDGTSTVGSYSMAPGRYGNGVLFNNPLNDVRVILQPGGGLANIELDRGRIEFWYKPNYAHTDNVEHYLFDIDADMVVGSSRIRLTKESNVSGGAGPNALTFEVVDAASASRGVSILSTNYAWKAGEWIHLAMEWDSTDPTDNVRAYLDGVQLVPVATANGVFAMQAETNLGVLRIGNKAILPGSWNADGIMDEFRVYGSASAPEEIAHGGLQGDSREKLSNPSASANFSLALQPVDGFARGRYLFFGFDSKPRGLNVSLATAGAGVADDQVKWFFWDGAAWQATTPDDDETDSFKQTGTISWNADLPGWSPYAVSGGPDLYYLMARLDPGASYTTTPVEGRIESDILLFQYCGDITDVDRTFVFSPPMPTAVELMSFDAAGADGMVGLSWRTGSELDNLGFHLYRGPLGTGPWTRVTQSLIPGLGSSPEGASYTWTDTGVLNGTRYFYRLEDVDTASVSTFHGPVSAVPQPPPGEGEGGEGEVPAPSPGSGSPEPLPPGVGEPPESPVACPEVGPCLYGDPGEPTLRVVSRSVSGMTVELQTPGFFAFPDPPGASVDVSGFVLPTRADAVDLPFKRAVLDAVVGRRARLVSIEATGELYWTGLRPAAVARPEVDARSDGTVRAVRRRVPLAASLPGTPSARIAGHAFMGQAKKLALELHPLRWDSAQNRLVLSRTLRVRIAFAGDVPGESGNGSFGRRNPRPRRTAPPVFAHLHTTEKGLHAVAYEDVFPSPRRATPLSALRLVQDGRVVPFHVEPPGPAFGPGSVLFFHADRTASSTDYSGEVSWALERAPGVQMATGSAAPSSAPLTSASYAQARFETQKIYQSGLLDAPDIWLWDFLTSGTTKDLSLDLEAVDTTSALQARVRLYLQGASDSARVGEHHITASWNGVLLDGISFERKLPYLLEGTVPAASLNEGTNTLTLTNVGDTGVHSLVFLDRVEVDYPQLGAIRAGRFSGAWTQDGVARVTTHAPDLKDSHSEALLLGHGPKNLSVSSTERSFVASPSRAPQDDNGGRTSSRAPRSLAGAFNSAAAVDVTDPAAPVWLSGLEAGLDSVRLQAQAGRRYAVVSPEGLLTPRVSPVGSVARGVETGLRDTRLQADYILVAPQAFMDAAQPLLIRRESQGLTTFAASLEQIAADFGGGAPSGEAIRSFLAFAFHSWKDPAPRYVLLLGDASYDPRNFTGSDPGAPLPALWTKTSYLWTASDPALAAVNGEDLLPDLALGRLPATNLVQAEALVRKVLDWEDAGYDLSAKVTLVADNPDRAGDFEADITDISRSFLGTRSHQSLLVRLLGANTRPSILDAMNSGISLLTYVGHGGSAVWASENVLNSLDTPSLQAQSRQPLMLTMNCLNGYFVSPAIDALAEAFLKVEGRGTIAAFSPSGLSLDGPAHVFHRAVVHEVVNGNHERLGDAVLAAQQAYALSGHMPELLAVYNLLGDPALVIRR